MKDKETNNETVAEIVREIRTIWWMVYNQEIEVDDDCGVSQSYCNTLSDRLKAAHDREIAAKNRKIAILEERVRIAIRAFEKIDAITKEEETAIIAGHACSHMTADDHAYKYLFEAEPEEKSE